MLNGIDMLKENDFGLRGVKLGLITSPTGLCKDLSSSIDALNADYTLKALYSPEHGLRGDMAAGDEVKTYTDSITGLPVYSLYNEQKRPEREMLEDIDALVMDVQDVGSRYYTYISTMRNCMEACAQAGKTFVVLDRPNPLRGNIVEGNKLDLAFASFVGIAPIPQRHGLTMGELALLFNKEYEIGCDLKVVPMEGWHRDLYYDDTDLIWVNPSPNIPGMDAALLYPGTCLFEGTNLSEGRGTTKPFEMIGAPWLDAEILAEELNSKKNPAVIYRPVYFRPSSSKYKDELCAGVQAHIIDRRELEPIALGLTMLSTIREIAGDKFEWLAPLREGEHYFIDLLAGTDSLRKEMDIDRYLDQCKLDSESFKKTRQAYLLYE